jgi:hypothetical protein
MIAAAGLSGRPQDNGGKEVNALLGHFIQIIFLWKNRSAYKGPCVKDLDLFEKGTSYFSLQRNLPGFDCRFPYRAPSGGPSCLVYRREKKSPCRGAHSPFPFH